MRAAQRTYDIEQRISQLRETLRDLHKQRDQYTQKAQALAVRIATMTLDLVHLQVAQRKRRAGQ